VGRIPSMTRQKPRKYSPNRSVGLACVTTIIKKQVKKRCGRCSRLKSHSQTVKTASKIRNNAKTRAKTRVSLSKNCKKAWPARDGLNIIKVRRGENRNKKNSVPREMRSPPREVYTRAKRSRRNVKSDRRNFGAGFPIPQSEKPSLRSSRMIRVCIRESER